MLPPKFVGFLPRIAKWARGAPFVRQAISWFVIEGYARATAPRPRPFSLAADYTTWQGLTDRMFSGRHLPVPNDADRPIEPPPDDVLALFLREGDGTPAEDTSVMFTFFAQWFTDSFLRTDWDDNRKNTSNHEIDLCQIYGLTVKQTDALRGPKNDGLVPARRGGLLKSQMLKDNENREAEFPPFLFERRNGTLVVKDEFKDLHSDRVLDIVLADVKDPEKAYVFAVGLEHGNSVIGNSMLNTLFLREHNRIARQLASENPIWDDERLFQTARNILIVILLKLIVEEYIVQIGPDFPLETVPFIADGKRWNKSNWIAIEFNLLYRWHQLVPNKVSGGERSLSLAEMRNNNPLVVKEGIDNLFEFLSRSRAGKIGLFNTHSHLVTPQPNSRPSVEQRTIKLMRDARLASYNAYRTAFGLAEKKSFEDLTKDKRVIKELKALYGTVDKLEWYVGIFAEGYKDSAMMGELMTTMVAHDAFTQALTNPLLSRNVFNEQTFTRSGLKLIEVTNSLQDIVHRNCPTKPWVSFSVKTE